MNDQTVPLSPENWTLDHCQSFLRVAVEPAVRAHDMGFTGWRRIDVVAFGPRAAVFACDAQHEHHAVKLVGAAVWSDEESHGAFAALGDCVATDQQQTRTPVSRPVAYLPQLRTLVTEYVPGPTLRQVLRGEHQPLKVAAFAGAARWLASYHSCRRVGSGPLNVRGPLRSIGAAIERMRSSVSAEVLQRAQRELTALERSARIVRGGEIAMCRLHGDSSAANFIMRGTEMVAIDLKPSRVGDPLVDYATLAVETMLDDPSDVGGSKLGIADTRVHAIATASEWVEPFDERRFAFQVGRASLRRFLNFAAYAHRHGDEQSRQQADRLCATLEQVDRYFSSDAVGAVFISAAPRSRSSRRGRGAAPQPLAEATPQDRRRDPRRSPTCS